MEFLEPLKNDIIEIILDPVGVPKCFHQLSNIVELTSTYKRIYSKLVNQKFSLASGKSMGETHKVELKVRNSKVKEHSDDECVERIRKVIKIQGDMNEVGPDYLNQMRANRAASMNADI